MKQRNFKCRILGFGTFRSRIRWRSPIRAGQLQHIVRRAQEAPLAADFFDSAEQELPEAPRKFDVTEHRLDDLLA